MTDIFLGRKKNVDMDIMIKKFSHMQTCRGRILKAVLSVPSKKALMLSIFMSAPAPEEKRKKKSSRCLPACSQPPLLFRFGAVHQGLAAATALNQPQ